MRRVTENKKIIYISQYFPVFPTLRVLDRAVPPGKYRPGISRTTLTTDETTHGSDHTPPYALVHCPAAVHLDFCKRSYLASDDGSTREGRHFPPCEALTEMSTHQGLFIASFARAFPEAK